MYGTVARIRPKPGRIEDIIALMQEWERDYKPRVDGAMAGYLYRLDAKPNELIMCAVFRDRASYKANADSQDQDKWFRRFRELLETDPVWEDGEVIATG